MKLRTKVIAVLAAAGLAALAFQAGASAAAGGPATTLTPSVRAAVPGLPAALPFPAQTETVFHPIDPVRILDTRSSLGGHAGPIFSSTPFNLQVTGGAVPPGADAVEFNLTVVNPTASSFLTVFPTGTRQPTVSNINYVTGQTVANSNTVRLGLGGRLTIKPGTGSTNVLVDVAGYYSTSTAWGQHGYIGWVTASDTGITESHSNNGSAITIVNNGTGSYEVTFHNANIDVPLDVAKANVQVSATGNPVLCTTNALVRGSDLVVLMSCLDTVRNELSNVPFYLQVTG